MNNSKHETRNAKLAAAVLMAASALALATGGLVFPKDHGAHADAALEWWYWTGHLKGSGGRDYGFLLVFFRLRQFHMAHFAWTDISEKTFRFDEKAHLGLPGIAGAKEGGLDVVNEDWSAKDSGGVQALHAALDGAEIALDLNPEKPPVIHGEGGISRKGAGENEYSHYVSITRLKARGSRKTGAQTEALSGTAWFDHEWGPGALPAEAAGWDWFSLQLDDGSELMLYRMRRADGSATPVSSGTFVPARGAPQRVSWPNVSLEPRGEWTSPHSSGRYPSGWKLAVRSIGLEAVVTPSLADQELVTGKSTGVTYWEGACRVEGTRAGRAIRGRAYVELTGYAGRDVPGFAGGLLPQGDSYEAGAGLGVFTGFGGFSRVSSDTMKLAALSRFR